MNIKAIIIGLVTLLSGLSVAQAEVIGIEIEERVVLAEGLSFGDYGAYEKISGIITIALDPANPENAAIVDLEFAPTNERGLVEARANFMVLQPVDPEKRRGLGFLEVSNRGGKAGLRYFNAATDVTRNPESAAHLGDGFLMRQGLTVIWVGWQFDIEPGEHAMWLAAPRTAAAHEITGLVRSDRVIEEDVQTITLGHRGAPASYQASAVNDAANQLTVRDGRDAERHIIPRHQWRFGAMVDGEFQANRTHLTLEGGFKAGKIYEIVYVAEDPVITGFGPAAVRDMVAYAKYDPASPFSVDKMLGFGVSQTGRFLRLFLHQGFNSDEAGRQVFDGLLIHTAGAGRGSFNHRFAQPSRDGHQFSTFFSPTDIFPYSSALLENPLTGKAEGMFSSMRHPDQLPKIFYTNTGYEYWGRAASLLHTTTDGEADVTLLDSERIYHLASGQHFVESFPPGDDRDLGQGRYRGLPLDFLVNLRALTARLGAWVESDRRPPRSRYPRHADGTLVAHDTVEYPAIPGFTAAKVLQTAYVTDFGRRWSQGIIDNQPPLVSRVHVPRVSAVDRFGNETAGVQNVELQVPLATYIPWNLRGGRLNPDQLTNFRGTYIPLPLTDEAAALAGDPRPSIASLYTDRSYFAREVQRAARDLVRDGFLLDEDIPRVLSRNLLYWDCLHGVGCE